MSKTALYRHYGENYTLLYVGVTINPYIRIAKHKNNSEWYEEIRSITFEWHETRDDALAAEAIALSTEDPIYNINGRYTIVPQDGTHPEAKQFYTPQEIASMLQLSTKRMNALLRDGEIKSVDVGGVTRVSVAAFDEYITGKEDE